MTSIAQTRSTFWMSMVRGVSLRMRHFWVRRRVQALGDLDDKMLDDIGVTREEVYSAARTPLHLNASEELYRTAYLRRSRKR